MPPTPDIELTVNEAKLQEVCDDLGIAPPRVYIRPARDGRTLGQQLGNTVTIYAGLEEHSHGRLRYVTAEVTNTLLHELRHVHQDKNWTTAQWAHDARHSYNIKPSEEDARDYASKNERRFAGLVRVRREQQSKIGRLSKAESLVRQSV